MEKLSIADISMVQLMYGNTHLVQKETTYTTVASFQANSIW